MCTDFLQSQSHGMVPHSQGELHLFSPIVNPQGKQHILTGMRGEIFSLPHKSFKGESKKKKKRNITVRRKKSQQARLSLQLTSVEKTLASIFLFFFFEQISFNEEMQALLISYQAPAAMANIKIHARNRTVCCWCKYFIISLLSVGSCCSHCTLIFFTTSIKQFH